MSKQSKGAARPSEPSAESECSFLSSAGAKPCDCGEVYSEPSAPSTAYRVEFCRCENLREGCLSLRGICLLCGRDIDRLNSAAPQTSAEPTQQEIGNMRIGGKLDVLKAELCPECHAPQSENEHKTWCSRYSVAPQSVSASHRNFICPTDEMQCDWPKCVDPKSGDSYFDAECLKRMNAVSGDAPKVDIRQKCVNFLCLHPNPKVDELKEFIEALRRYFPPVSQTPELESPLPWTTSGDSPENPPMIWAADGDSIVNQMPDGTPYFEPEVARFIVRVANLATPASTARTDGWVSVEESGLPKVGHWCWVVYHGVVQRMAAQLIGKGFACVDGYEWAWAIDEADPCPLEEITHWQPLPAAPGSVPEAPKCSEPRVVELNPPNAPDKYAVFIGKVFIWEFDYEKEAEELRDNLKRGVPQAEPPKKGE